MPLASLLPKGTRVVLTGLQKAPEHNGKVGVVESVLLGTNDERHQVRLAGDGKTVAIRAANLRLEPRPVETLSVKELKYILANSECNQDPRGMDKKALQTAVSDISSPEKNAEILFRKLQREQQPKAASPAAAADNSSARFSKEQIEATAEQMSSMDPAVLRQQAAAFRTMPPEQLRRQNPMFAGMSDEQIRQAASQLELMASNPAMMKAAVDQMKGMSPEEMERQGKAVLGTNSHKAAAASSSSSTIAPDTGRAAATTTTTSSQATNTSSPVPPNFLDTLSQMDPEQMEQQLKQQAALIKSLPPAQLRSMHPQFAAMSDAQITQMVAQMELMSSNPAMLKAATDQMKTMTPEQIQQLQETGMPSPGGSSNNNNASSSSSSPLDPSMFLSNLTGKQVKELAKTAEENPDMLKAALPNVDPQTVQALIQKVNSMNESTLDWILSWLGRLQRVAQTVLRWYRGTHRAVGGHLWKLLLWLPIPLTVVALLLYRRYNYSQIDTVDDDDDAGGHQLLEGMAPQETTTTVDYEDEF